MVEKREMVEVDLTRLGAKDAASAQKLIDTFAKQRDLGKKRDKVIQASIKALKTKYATEFKAMVEAGMKKAGLK